MRVIYNNLIPLKGFAAINLFGIIFIRRGIIVDEITLNHEAIHTTQMKELWYVGFYLLYILEWIIKLFFYKRNAYYNISFEREAYENQYTSEYLKKRKRFNWINKLLK